jgi:pSer/pThr/pTyr-binding forkhead associated (FHA) protein
VRLAGSAEVRRCEETNRLGRPATNAVDDDHAYDSGQHVEVRRTADGWELVDVGSTNGTFIDGERVTRVRLGRATRVVLGPGGPEVLIEVPALELAPDGTTVVPATSITDRDLGETAPDDMSERTRVLRASLLEHRQEVVRTWSERTRLLRIAVGVLLIASVTIGGVAVIQSRRVSAQRLAAASLFHTMKSLELDVRRLQEASGPDPSVQERQQRLEAQYEDLLTTLGIYSDRTPEDVRLIYRTVHRLGESEATVPHGFVDEVRRYIGEWKAADLQASMDRAKAGGLGPMVSRILLDHSLPREFFYLALQESKFDAKAVGGATRFGFAKGMWQMIPMTAEAYGLRVGSMQGERRYDPGDERYDVEKSTAAAARYLADIYTTDAQASGLLVMAAYNLGEPRMLSLIRSMPESPAERNFWALLEKHRDQIPEETYSYVFRIVSAAVIGANPRLFGFDFDPPLGSRTGDASRNPTP